MATHKIVAKDTAKPTKAQTAEVVTAPKPKNEKVKKPRKGKNPFVRLGGYFVGAWHELREVRWPNRKATWSLTAAVLLFVLFFGVLIALLDALWKFLFQLILK